MMRTRVLSLILLLITAALPLSAHAQPSEDGISAALYYGYRGGVESFIGGAPAANASAGELHLDALLSFGSMGIAASWGVALGAMSPTVTDLTLPPGPVVDPIDGTHNGLTPKLLNPFLGAYYLAGDEASKVRLGLGVALPFAQLGSSLGHAAALLPMAAAHGDWNLWLYRGDFAAVLPARGSLRVLDWLEIAGEGAIAIARNGNAYSLSVGAPVIDPNGPLPSPGAPASFHSSSGGTDLIYQLAAEAAVKLPIEPGLRLQWVQRPTSTSHHDVQLSALPFARVAIGAARVEVGATYNITSPLGPSLAYNTAWGAHAGVNLSL
jgi:hypothetical protein